MKPVDPILPSDIDAYVDDQLDTARRIEVEAFLSRRPEIAATVMADRSIRGELRLALATAPIHGRPETRDAARRLQGALSRHRIIHSLQRAAAIAMLLGAGWVANSTIGPFTPSTVEASTPAPSFVDAAITAHTTSKLRETMPSQTEATSYDTAGIRSATAIVMPEIPADWRVKDVQIFPSAFGPSVEVTILRNGGERLSLFAVRPGNFAVQQAALTRSSGVQASYWQIGDVAYALVSETDRSDRLRDEAQTLADTLY
ncbi:anti-sigma factor family protein [Neorhizobium sp. NPDC001467]|uniref:anti-sigma factor family protein n=1 Tax=Neorhizobium sp. NPDC001467 TaxID=3390595 RepID=UPI003D094F3A